MGKTKMDQFVETMQKAFDLANEIEGISSIEWSIRYHGNIEATNELSLRIGEAMRNSNMGNIGIQLNNKPES